MTREEIIAAYKLKDVDDKDTFSTLPNGTLVYFRDKSHRYYWLDGNKKRPLVSVTTILRVLNKPQLLHWAWDQGMQGIDYRETRDEASTRGTSVHDALEKLATDGTPPSLAAFPEDDRGYVQAVARWWLDFKPEPVATEVVVAHCGEMYAGRFDLLARIDGRLWLLDLKTSKSIYAEAHLQMAGYLAALEDCGWEPMPDALGVIRAGQDGSYEFCEVKATAEQFMAVAGARRAVTALEKDLREAAKALRVAA